MALKTAKDEEFAGPISSQLGHHSEKALPCVESHHSEAKNLCELTGLRQELVLDRIYKYDFSFSTAFEM